MNEQPDLTPASIKVNVADRPYRVKALPQEADRVRQAAQIIQEKVRTMRNQYGVTDKQDALAMTALLLSTELLEQQDNAASSNENTTLQVDDDLLTEKLQQLDDILTEFLQKG